MTAKERKVIKKVTAQMLKALDKIDEILDRMDFAEDREPKEKVVKKHYC